MNFSRRRFNLLSAMFFSTLCISACSRSHRASKRFAQGTILALGDSLTYGYGSSGEAHSYPALLAQASGRQVINAGINGDTSHGALARLPALLQEHQPALVLIGIGGNDFLQKQDEAQTRSNIAAIIERCQEHGAAVVLIAIPAFSLGAALGFPKDHPLYQELAQRYDVPLFAHAWSDILGKDALKSDQIHANDQGYRLFAERLQSFLEKESVL